MAHRHKDSRAKWTTTDAEPPQFTAAEVKALKLLIAAGGSGGGTTPVPNDPPPPPPPDITAPTILSFTQTVTGTTSVRFNATANEAATVVYRYGTTAAMTSSTAPTAAGTPVDVTGLTSGTTYYCRADATDTAGNGPTLSSVRQFTTQQVPAPPPGTSITVGSISALKAALAQNVYTEIVVTDGTYSVAPAGNKASNSLWIGAAYAGRTNPVTVRAQTTGGVTFDGGGTTYFGGIRFDEGAHHQTWQGFKFANGVATATGVIFFGGNAGQPGPHHITLEDITVMSSCTSSQPPGVYHDHAMYVSHSLGGVHDIVIDGFTVDQPGAARLDSAIQFFHSTAPAVNAYNFTVRNAHVTGTKIAFIVWDETLSNIVLEDCDVTNAVTFAVRLETTNALTLRRFQSTGTGVQGFYTGTGGTPTYDGCAYVGGEFVLT